MKIISVFLFITLWTSGFSQKVAVKNNKHTFTLPVNSTEADYLPNRIIIKYKFSSLIVSNISLKSAKVVSLNKKFPARTTNQGSEKPLIQSKKVVISSQNSEVSDLSGIYELKYSGSSPIEDVINELLQDNSIEYAEPHYISHALYVPNDKLYYDLGQSYLRQVKAPEAWDVRKGSTDVVIAVVDGGSDVAHPDLASNIFLNSADRLNGLDDDLDGFIDNYTGWDFAGQTIGSAPDNDPTLKTVAGNHGVHVSGLASAVSDNNIGISSIAFNSKLLIIKAAPDDDPNTIYFGYEGIKYAADHGAHIINCSWSSTANSNYGQDIINYAISKGCLVIASAGNRGSSIREYPAGYDGVFPVASVQSSDVKSVESNYGDHIRISAPGDNIISTVNPNSYGISSGTSMSAPIVSSAAALVKAHFPALTMQQVGEKLRVTADFIDDKNPGFEGLLGKGRLNVFKALTQSAPSLRNQKLTVSSSANRVQGDTLLLYFDLKNFLDPAINLKVRLASSSPFISVLTQQIGVGNVATLQTLTMIGPFKVSVLASAPDNALALFRISYSSDINAYNDSESFTISVGLDYLNVNVNNINTTMTSNGRIGYRSTNSTDGVGLVYQQQNLLNEASLMIGNSPTVVSNNARFVNKSDEHFLKTIKAKRTGFSASDFSGISEFDDSANPKSLGLYIKHKITAFANPPDDKYIIAEYEVVNRSNSELRNLFIGLFTDWEIDVNGADVTKFDPFSKIAYVYGKSPKSMYAGIKLLTNTAPPLYYPLSTSIQNDPLTNGFTIDQKFKTLSSGVKALSLGEESPNGYDISFVSGYGPFVIPPNHSAKVAFAFLVGDDLYDLQKSAEAAQFKYQMLAPDNIPESRLVLKQNYPNPAQNNTMIEFSIPKKGLTTLNIFNSVGQKITTLLDQNLDVGTYSVNMNTTDLKPGVYIYRLCFLNTVKASKMIVIK